MYIPEGCTREAHTFRELPMHCYPCNFHWAASYNDVHLPFEHVSKKMITKEILDYIREFKQASMNRKPLYTFETRALFELILQRMLSDYHLLSANTIDPRIKNATYYINEQFSHNITVGILAEQANLNTVYFGKLFKETTDLTYKEYLYRIRINNAEMMLSSGDFNV
ncbi:AraC family transcriptional regulator [Paenibacillus polymyxa]|uniref:helix-turn-helix transcriptional regulator n=1 Tax=Paenibacillus polymyxa TaxID=1406 RepID=UPI003B5AD5CE